MIINQALKLGVEKIKAIIPDSPFLDAELLLTKVLKKSREFVISHPEQSISKKIEKEYFKLISIRTKHYPVAYLLGHQEFYGFKFKVNSSTLVPRPDSEIIIDEALNILRENIKKNWTIIDIGTGSGCLIITLNKLTESLENNKFIGIDISEQAIKIAKSNARSLKAKGIRFIKNDLLNNINSSKLNSPLLILANLPYLTKEQIDNSPSIKREPYTALYGGPGGLKYYKQLFKQLVSIKRDNPKNEMITLVEIDPSQNKSIIELSKKIFKKERLELVIKKDLGKRDRLVIIKI